MITNESWYAPIILTHCYIRSIRFSPNLKSWKLCCHVLDIAYSFLFFFPPLFNLFHFFFNLIYYRFRQKLIKICFYPFELSGINLDRCTLISKRNIFSKYGFIFYKIYFSSFTYNLMIIWYKRGLRFKIYDTYRNNIFNNLQMKNHYHDDTLRWCMYV